VGEGVYGATDVCSKIESILTVLLNEITTVEHDFLLVLDDYHVIETRAVEDALSFLLEHLPPRMHLLISSREDPALPLARNRARGQLTEVRAVELRFTLSEAAEYLKGVIYTLCAERKRRDESIKSIEQPNRAQPRVGLRPIKPNSEETHESNCLYKTWAGGRRRNSIHETRNEYKQNDRKKERRHECYRPKHLWLTRCPATQGHRHPRDRRR
jgi:hypothetical protein